MIYRADWLLTMDGPPIRDGAVQVDKGRISKVGPITDFALTPRTSVRHLDDTVLLPGLINCHAHLELGMLRGALSGDSGFTSWVQSLREALYGMDEEEFRTAVALGIREGLKNGITTIVDVGNTGVAAEVLREAPVRSWACFETLGLNWEFIASGVEARIGRVESLGKAAPPRFRAGITCHAPYSCHGRLFERVLSWNRKNGGLFTIHAAESREEWELFSEGRGALWEFCLERAGQDLFSRRSTPIAYLEENGWLPDRTLLVHGNFSTDADMAILARRKASVALCPRSREFLGHPVPPLKSFLNAGINLCLGTDSLASNPGLDLFMEMAALKEQFSFLSSERLLEMATVSAGRALGQEGELGVLKKGARADFMGIGLRHDTRCNLYDEIVMEEAPIDLVVIDGEEILG